MIITLWWQMIKTFPEHAVHPTRHAAAAAAAAPMASTILMMQPNCH